MSCCFMEYNIKDKSEAIKIYIHVNNIDGGHTIFPIAAV